MRNPLDDLDKYQAGPEASVREKNRFFLSMGFTMLVNAEPGTENEDTYDRVHLSIGTNDCEAWKELAGKRVRNLYRYGLRPSEDKQRKDEFGHKCEI